MPDNYLQEPLNRRKLLRNLGMAAASAGGAAMVLNRPVAAQSSAGAYWNVKDFGAVGNGATDDTAAFQNALNAAGVAKGGIVIAPRGDYRINGTLSIPSYVTLEGVFTAPTAFSQYHGTTLLAYSGRGNANGTPFITLDGLNSTIKGLTIFYPEQNNPNAIVPYPWTIRGGSSNDNIDNVTVLDVLLVNPYQAVDFATYRCGRHLIRGLYGQPLRYGIWVDKCLDIGRIEDVHFWPFWDINALPFMASSSAAHAATALHFGRSDWQIVNNFFGLGYHVGVQFGEGSDGLNPPTVGSTNGQFSNLNLDAMNCGLDVYAIAPYGVQITNLNIACTSNLGQDIRRAIWSHNTAPYIGMLSIVNGSFWGSFLAEAIRWEKGEPLQIASSRFLGWASGQPAIDIVGGRATISGNYFQDQTGKSVRVNSGAQEVIVTGNQLLGNPVESYGPPGLRLIANNL